MAWGNHPAGHKKTMSCSQNGCNYTSRQFVVHPKFNDKEKNRYANESRHCPFHNVELVYKPEVNHPKK